MKNKKLIIAIIGVLAVVITTLIITLSVNNSNTKPDVISINGHKVSYCDTFTVGDNLYGAMKVLSFGDYLKEQANCIGVGSGGTTRSISIYDSRITTYKGIKVGDNISKINKNFKFAYFYTDDKWCTVAFKGNKEINNTSDYGTEEKIFWIHYIYNENNIITKIILDEPMNQ